MARRDFVQRVILRLKDEATPGVNRIASSFASFGKGVAAVGASVAAAVASIEILQRAYNGLVRSASESENAQRRLAQVLNRSGEDASQFTKALQEQAQAYEDLGLASDTQITNLQRLLVNFGASAEQLQEATDAAVNLSAAFGIDLESAARQVGRTFGGFAGELGEVVPELRSLSAEALKSGEAVAILNEKFGGQAQEQAKEFAVALNAVAEAANNVGEALGSEGDRESAVGSVKGLADNLNELAPALEGSRLAEWLADASEAWTDLKANLTEGIRKVGQATGLLRTNAEIARDAANATDEFSDSQARLTAKLEAQAKAAQEAAEADEAFLDSLRELGVTLDQDVNAELEKNQETLAELDDQYRRGTISTGDYREAVAALEASSRELNAQLSTAPQALQQTANATDRAAESARRYGAEIGRVNTQLEVLTQRQQQAAQADEARALAGRLGIVARDPRNQAEVDAAVLAGYRPTFGGTRIKTPSGSRLLR